MNSNNYVRERCLRRSLNKAERRVGNLLAYTRRQKPPPHFEQHFGASVSLL